LRRKLGGRSLATALIVMLFLGIAGLTAWGVYHPVKHSTSQFIQRLPQYWERVQKPLLKIQQKAAVSERKIKEEVTTEIIQEDAITNGTSSATNRVNRPAPRRKPPVSEEAEEGTSNGFIQTGLSQAMTGVAGTF